MKTQVYDRDKHEIIEINETQAGAINFLYKTKLGVILLNLLISRPIFSKIISFYYKSRLSKKKIHKFITENNIDTSNIDINSFRNFNDFFTRENKQLNIDTDTWKFISPAQSKVIVYNIDSNSTRVKVKQVEYTVSEIMGDQEQAEKFIGGYCVVFRLSTTDYHRYIYIDDGNLVGKQRKIVGKLHTVRDEASNYRVLAKNSREVSLWDTSHLGMIAVVEVGALTIGKIVNHPYTSNIHRGKEKGYFEYGGSTIVIFLQKDRVTIDKDIQEQSKLGIETIVNIGERIGEII